VGEPQSAASAKLIFLCGKMAAGKSTLARELAQRENAVLLVQDDFLDLAYRGGLREDVEALVNTVKTAWVLCAAE